MHIKYTNLAKIWVFELIFLLGLSLGGICFARPPVTVTATMLKVSDGDTIWASIEGRRVKLRLLGIDTPEKFASRKLERDALRCGVSTKYMRRLGIAATRYAKSLLHRGQKVRVTLYGRGYYGRSLAMVYLPDGTCYNEDIVRDGYACLYKYHGHRSKQIPLAEWRRLQSLLTQAQQGRVGLWGEYFEVSVYVLFRLPVLEED